MFGKAFGRAREQIETCGKSVETCRLLTQENAREVKVDSEHMDLRID